MPSSAWKKANPSNDSCYVQRKNWSVVRQAVGYDRYEGQDTVDLLNRFYEYLRLYNNFFQTSQKLISKERHGGTVHKKHDAPATPYRRLMLDPNVVELDKKALKSDFLALDLLQIRAEMDKLLVKIKSLSLDIRNKRVWKEASVEQHLFIGRCITL